MMSNDPSQKLLGPQAGVPMGVPQQGARLLPNVPGAAAVAQQMAPVINPADIPQIEHLGNLPSLFIRQRIDLLELFAQYDVSNTYEVFLTDETRKAGASWLLAKEESECMQRACLPRCREFTIDVGVPGGNSPVQTIEQQLGLVSSKFVIPMFRIHRPCFFCLPQFELADSRGQHVASGKEDCISLVSCLPTSVSVFGPGRQIMEGEPDFTLTGPSRCTIHCLRQIPCRDELVFEFKTKEGEHLGRIANEPTGCVRMCFTSADDYRVDFAPGSAPAQRATLLALAFLTDFRYFEVPPRPRQQSNGFVVSGQMG